MEPHSVNTGVIANNYGAGATPLINGRDVAEIGYLALTDPKVRTGGPILHPGPTELFTQSEIAELISAQTGHEVRHSQNSTEQ
jgi:hypothetical protein